MIPRLDHVLTMSYLGSMNRTRLSSKGQVVLPKSVREALRLEAGTEFIVTTTAHAVVLSRVAPFPATTLEQVYGCLPHVGRPRTLEEMDAGIRMVVARRANVAAGTRRRARSAK